MIKNYFSITKPGIIWGNAITTIAGFALASRGSIEYLLLLATLVGISFIIASACVFNNYFDRDIDEKMTRTKNRALVTHSIPAQNALIFASVLGSLGCLTLALYTNLLTLCLAIGGFFVYVLVYGILKRISSFGTLIGSIAGAIPPVIGYTAVTNCFDGAALLLFLIVALWQMPHFFAIAIYRLDDYKAASIPVLPAVKGLYNTKIQMFLYIIAFIIATCMLTLFGYMGYAYLIVTGLLGFAWLGFATTGFTSTNDTLWARKMFLFSLVIVMGLSIMIPLDVN